MSVFMSIFVSAIFGAYYLTHSLGWAVVLVTVVIKLLLLPLVLPSLRSAKKMSKLQPRLKKIQEKHKGDKQKLAMAQMDLYKSEGVNPMGGCLPQILQIVVLIMFFSAFNKVIGFSNNGNGETVERNGRQVTKVELEEINSYLIPSFKVDENFKFKTDFLGSDLAETPKKAFTGGNIAKMILPGILLIGSGLAQFLGAKMMMPSSAKASDDTAYTKETPGKEDDMMAAMRTQSLYMMPLMTVFIGWSFSLGILLYWFVNSVMMIGQQVLIGKKSN
ncbi:YidC/Oxa1 family membrane protein insertase [Patescibacteria group bacterium]|nr:YidC/Oxa1 family membrane protein insertase [Patescibacteria group bacterium]MBU4389905.1 YidC/Oxa1 family membrane protein insertase [Patescibacteria group bacterium]MBU4397185.1 YidC/Oxa1 family membrane protein insertase [Patescibacteria group bacterium]MCG2701588.1 YidC/Oxa1 family membrane protein insertase [Candidatus Parcubacteria bacterium]